ncbi:hypothetical protein ABT093_09580 [Kitasatospora sp. NPDC002551]|uniref:hypothetical protein n=1 Tax=Kitasatospora sp. NPDC002551 TaxID=3154539 RepID=UPI00332D53B6
MPDALPLPADLLPLHAAERQADRAMTQARLDGGDVDAAIATYLEAASALDAHPIWEQARQAGAYHQTRQDSLKAAKAALGSETAAA